jgi:hypothetical protein
MADPIRLRSGQLDWRSVEDQVVVLDSLASVYLGINRTGATLWKAIAAGDATRDSLTELLEDSGAPQEGARRDVDAFIEALADLGLLAEAE